MFENYLEPTTKTTINRRVQGNPAFGQPIKMKTVSSNITPALDGTARITVLNTSGEAIQTVLFSDYLREHDMSEACIALVLDGEEVYCTHTNPAFNHSVRLA